MFFEHRSCVLRAAANRRAQDLKIVGAAFSSDGNWGRGPFCDLAALASHRCAVRQHKRRHVLSAVSPDFGPLCSTKDRSSDMNALFALAFAALHLSSTVLLGVLANPAPAPNPMITPAPVVGGSVQRARAADDVPTTIPLADCLFSVECCQQVFTLPVLPLSLTTALPITAPIPLPTLGPLAGVDCSDASDLDPITNQWYVVHSVTVFVAT